MSHRLLSYRRLPHHISNLHQAATLQSGDPDRAVVASRQEMRSRPQAAELQTATPTERWLSAEVTAEAEATLAALYSKLQKAYPKSQACMRLPPVCVHLQRL